MSSKKSPSHARVPALLRSGSGMIGLCVADCVLFWPAVACGVGVAGPGVDA
jgi:hypothetical protein